MGHDQLTRVAPVNAAQADAWDGDEGRFWAEHADHFDAALRGYRAAFLDAARLLPTDAVLDVGCGAGETTLDAARTASAGTALGVDLSAAMLEVARARAATAGLDNATFLQADAQVHPFSPDEYDVVIGRTSAMFFGDPEAAFANLAAALRPGGRLVLLVWQGLEHNEWLRCILGAMAAGRDLAPPPPGAPGPFALAQPDRVRDLLLGAGFTDLALDDVRRPMWFGEDTDDATAFVAGLNAWMLRDLDDAGRRVALDALARTMHEHETADGVTFGSATWLVTATRG
jgi:SAM-dependent methyltransferase